MPDSSSLLVMLAVGADRPMAWLDRAAGLMFLGFGLRLALADNPTH